ncbi:MAG: MASE4 domain-containing protein [Rudaea sp.]
MLDEPLTQPASWKYERRGLGTRAADVPSAVFLSTLAPTRHHRMLARAVVAVSLAIFAALAPFASIALPQVWAFIPIYQSVIVTNDLITAVLLFGQFAILGRTALLALGTGYLLTALIAAVHTLSFPGLFAPAGVLGSGAQTTAWLYMAWHTAFPLAVIAYAALGREGFAPRALHGRRGVAVAACVVAALALVSLFTILVTAGHDTLPAIMQGDRYTAAMKLVVTAVWSLNALALIVLWRRRPHSVLDLWIMVACCAWLLDIALAVALNAGRFDLGFYAGRTYGVLAASFVLLMLLLENSVLYAGLARALQGERIERERVQEKTAELNELNLSLEQRVTLRTAELDASNRELKRQVAERERAEAAAVEAQQRLDGIIDSAMDGIVTIDEAQRIVLFNAAAEKLFGCPQSEAIGAPLAQFIPERFRGAHAEHVRRFGAEGVRSRRMVDQRTVMGLRRNGEEFPIEASISQATLRGRRYYTVILRDVTERLRAERALRRSQEELQEIVTVSATAREQEKGRIARELHDELAQSLAMLGMDLDWLRENIHAGDESCASKIAAMQKLLAGTVAATRRIAAEMRPLVLDDLGLVAATEWLVEKFRERYQIACTISIVPPQFELADPYATAVFRIMQEALANAARHAGASRVEVEMTFRNGEILLRVRDDGRGFDPTRPRKANSFGLVGLRERVHLVHGDIRVDSAPGRGTCIDVRIPVPQTQPVH